MTNSEILEAINEIFKIVFKDTSIKLSEDSSAADIDDWDSLSNIQIVIAVEKKFGIRFKSADIRGWNNVGEMCTSISELVK